MRWSGWNKQLASETSQSWERGPTGPGGSEGRADRSEGVEDLGKPLGPLPSFTTPLHRGGQQQVEQVLQARLV